MSELIYRYYTPKSFTNRVTIVGKIKNNFLELSAARCSDKDNFSRKIGRIIAEGRLNKKKYCLRIKLNKKEIQEFKVSKFILYAKRIENKIKDYIEGQKI